MSDVVIASAARTAIGTFGGGLSSRSLALSLEKLLSGKRCCELQCRALMLMRWY